MLVVSLEVRQFLQAPLVREHAAARPMVHEIVKAFERLGIDAVKDLDRADLAIGDQLRSASSLLLLAGRFDDDKIMARIKERAQERKGEVEILDEGGAKVFQCRLPPPPTQNPKVALPDQFVLTVLDPGTIAIGIDRAALTEALAKKAGRRKTNVRPRLAELVGRIESKQTVSVVYIPPAERPAGDSTVGLTTMTGGITVTDSIATDVRLEAKDGESAKSLADIIRQAMAKVRNILPGLAAVQLGLDRTGQDAIREMVDSVKVNTRQNTVIVSGTITREMIDKAGGK
ncbi:MAG TPA: hypothetical protein VH120_09215 [Gemmataceae bacterium]|nr:hypothetical protein [Gemmataceae bacterium]